jgi:hypothetical protein
MVKWLQEHPDAFGILPFDDQGRNSVRDSALSLNPINR